MEVFHGKVHLDPWRLFEYSYLTQDIEAKPIPTDGAVFPEQTPVGRKQLHGYYIYENLATMLKTSL
jgi:hypothetical protein